MPKFFPASLCLFTLCILLGLNPIQAQNLFPNPDFEQHSTCPTSYSQWSLLQDWNAGSASTPDYYNCGYYGVSVQGSPSTGQGVLGLWGGAQHPTCPTSAYTENITAALNQPLLAGQTYALSFDLQVDGQGFGSATPNDCIRFGFYFFDGDQAPDLSGVCSPTVAPQVSVLGTQTQVGQYQRFHFLVTPTSNWDQVLIGTFATANSGGSACSSYAGNKLYFNLDNLSLSPSWVLPADLLVLEGEIQQGKVALEWVMLGEGTDYEGFWLERCEGGDCTTDEQFHTLQYFNLQAQQDVYQFLDENPTAGFNFYRVRMIGKGQPEVRSETKGFFIQFPGPQLRAYPNPVVDQLCLVLTLTQDEIVSLGLQDLQGRTLWTERKVLPAGPHLVKIPAAHLAAGTYLLDFCTDSGRLNARERILVQGSM